VRPFGSTRSFRAGFSGAGVSPAFLRRVEIGKTAGGTPAPLNAKSPQGKNDLSKEG